VTRGSAGHFHFYARAPPDQERFIVLEKEKGVSVKDIARALFPDDDAAAHRKRRSCKFFLFSRRFVQYCGQNVCANEEEQGSETAGLDTPRPGTSPPRAVEVLEEKREDEPDSRGDPAPSLVIIGKGSWSALSLYFFFVPPIIKYMTIIPRDKMSPLI
jgi:hypothetical protein